MKPSIKGEIVREYLSKYPEMPKRTMARLIEKENKEVFTGYEQIRKLIGYHTGANGDHSRKTLSDKTFLRELKTNGENLFAKKGIELPEGLTTLDKWQLFKIFGTHKVLILSDAHIPYHNKKVLELAVNKGKEFEPDIIILNGDWIDHYSLSRWEKDPRLRNFSEERKIVLLSFEWLREIFPKSRIIFKMGNHCERYENYMLLKAPELLGIPNFDFENVFDLNNYGFELVKDMRPIKLNELFILHGHEYRFSISNPVNPARGLFLRAKVNAICGHFHQASSHSENDIEDKITATWSTGHLGDAHPKYMPLNKWNHGFAVVETSGNKNFQVHNYRIIDNEIFTA